ncbi:retrovirus-related pol polyprotein from transposon TNT 1-94, partial [Tanacetum coccineum]
SVNSTPTVKIVLNKGKQIWKPKGKLSDNSLNKTKQVWKAMCKLFANVGYQWRPTGKKFTPGKLYCGYQWRPTGKKFSLGELCPLTRLPVTCCSKHMTGNRSKLENFVEKFIGIYNKRTRQIMETIHVTFDELHQTMALIRISSGPEPFIMTPGQFKSRLAPTDKELEMLFQPMFDEHLEQSQVNEPVPSATDIDAQVVTPGTSVSTTIAQDASSTSASSSTSNIHHPVQHQEMAEEPIHEDTLIIHDVLHPLHNLVIGDPSSAQSSFGNVNSVEPNQVNYPPDHPLDNVVGNPSHPVSTRKQLASDALWYCFHTELSKVEPKNFKMAVIEDCWFQAMQDEIHEFDRLEVWELVPRPIYVMVIALKWIYKVKLDEYGDVLKNNGWLQRDIVRRKALILNNHLLQLQE